VSFQVEVSGTGDRSETADENSGDRVSVFRATPSMRTHSPSLIHGATARPLGDLHDGTSAAHPRRHSTRRGVTTPLVRYSIAKCRDLVAYPRFDRCLQARSGSVCRRAPRGGFALGLSHSARESTRPRCRSHRSSDRPGDAHSCLLGTAPHLTVLAFASYQSARQSFEPTYRYLVASVESPLCDTSIPLWVG
jgi:hypothetical protein